MHTVLLIVHILIAIALISLVLVQRGKGADMGAAFGSGASGALFGSRGSASFLPRATAVLASLFFITSLSLAFMFIQKSEVKSVTDISAPAPSPQPSKPAAPADVPAVLFLFCCCFVLGLCLCGGCFFLLSWWFWLSCLLV